MINILIIDDDEQFCELTSRYLKIEGFQTQICHDRQSGLQALSTQVFDVVLLDVMLPNDSGYSILEDLREHSTIPVIIYSALGDDTNEIIGLETGADAYVKKDSQPRLLTAKINSVLRRSQTEFQTKKQDKILILDDLELNRTIRQVKKDGELINLTVAEFNILEYLMLNAGEAKSKQDISQEALDKKMGRYDRSIDTHISRLRRKLGNTKDNMARIITIQGFGYKMNRNDKI